MNGIIPIPMFIPHFSSHGGGSGDIIPGLHPALQAFVFLIGMLAWMLMALYCITRLCSMENETSPKNLILFFLSIALTPLMIIPAAIWGED